MITHSLLHLQFDPSGLGAAHIGVFLVLVFFSVDGGRAGLGDVVDHVAQVVLEEGCLDLRALPQGLLRAYVPAEHRFRVQIGVGVVDGQGAGGHPGLVQLIEGGRAEGLAAGHPERCAVQGLPDQSALGIDGVLRLVRIGFRGGARAGKAGIAVRGYPYVVAETGIEGQLVQQRDFPLEVNGIGLGRSPAPLGAGAGHRIGVPVIAHREIIAVRGVVAEGEAAGEDMPVHDGQGRLDVGVVGPAG